MINRREKKFFSLHYFDGGINLIMRNNIVIKGAKVHNLKNVTVEIPRYKLLVFTGLSGSG